MVKTAFSFILRILVPLFILGSSCAATRMPFKMTLLSRDAVAATRNTGGYWIEVQIPQRLLVLVRGDKIVQVFPVAVGMPKYPTPVGMRSINSVVWNPWWFPPKDSDWVEDPTPMPPRSPDNPLGEIKMPLGKAYLIHGTKAVYSIGQWASHGCIRMLYEDLFSLVQALLAEYSSDSAIELMERANARPQIEFATPIGAEVPVFLSYEPVKIHDGTVILSPDFYRQIADMPDHIVGLITPHLKKREKPNLKKIKNLLKMFKGQTIHVSLEELVTQSKKKEKKESRKPII